MTAGYSEPVLHPRSGRAPKLAQVSPSASVFIVFSTLGPVVPRSPAPFMPWPGLSFGVKFLGQVDLILIYQKVEQVETFLGWETCDRYALHSGPRQ